MKPCFRCNKVKTDGMIFSVKTVCLKCLEEILLGVSND